MCRPGIGLDPYVYAPRKAIIVCPPTTCSCRVAEFPQNVIENSHVNVDGVLFQAGSKSEHTAVVMRVTTILPIPNSH